MSFKNWINNQEKANTTEEIAEVKKASSIFEFLDYLTIKKVKWEELSDSDKKAFNPYMINRWLSMNSGLTTLVAYLSKYTIGTLDKREVYRLYYYSLPKKKMFFQYVKGVKEEKYDSGLIDLVGNYFSVSNKESIEYIDVLTNNEAGLNQLKLLMSKFGKNEKEIKNMLKTK